MINDSTAAVETSRNIVIVGGGLVGSLEASKWSQKNYSVDVYEYRKDPRKEERVAGYSINLALSVRGREALRAVGAEDHIVKQGIPMYARMIHAHDGSKTSQPYGKGKLFRPPRMEVSYMMPSVCLSVRPCNSRSA